MIIQEINFLIVEALAELSPEKLDRFIELLAKDKRKVAVNFVAQNSFAEDVDIDQGDIISKINGKAINSLLEVEAIFNEKIEKNEKHFNRF